MNTLDEILRLLHEVPVHRDLATIDGTSLAMRAHARRDDLRHPMALAGVFALFVGVAGSALPPASAEAAPLLPLGSPVILAPSSLLRN